MRLSQLQTGTKILGAFAVVSFAIVIISIVALWRLQAADAITNDLSQMADKPATLLLGNG